MAETARADDREREQPLSSATLHAHDGSASGLVSCADFKVEPRLPSKPRRSRASEMGRIRGLRRL